jgi:hypothetical protein
MNLSGQTTSLLAFGTGFAIPLFFMVGVRTLFEWGRAAQLFWIALVAGSFLFLVLQFETGQRPNALFTALFPAIQLLWYHLLRRLMYGSWRAKPALVMFDFRPASGSQRDRVFGVFFVLSSLAIPLLAW